VADFQFVEIGCSGSPRMFWKVIEIWRCSRALRDAAVSRAKRGMLVVLRAVVGKSLLGGESGVAGVGVSLPRLVLPSDEVDGFKCERPSLLRRLRGAPRPIGVLVNLDSRVADVGRSSKISSSLPSP